MQKVLSSFSIIVILLLSQLLIHDNKENITEKNTFLNFTEGRQLDDIDCSGYTLEDLFKYDFAQFNFVIEDDWMTSSMFFDGYSNESTSAIVRENMDELFDGAPGGNNSWISTDEREAVREIGPKCIEDMETRLGLREGIPHRGGVDWNDFEFVEEGIALDEVNLVANGHPDERECQNLLASSNCTEVPVSVTDNLQIELFVANGENSNLRFDQLPNAGESNFTLALNLADIPNAEFVFTFPIIDGLRIADYAMEDDGIELIPGQDYDEPIEEFLPNGMLRIYQTVSHQQSSVSTTRILFIDFTTQAPIDSNDIPQWTTSAPSQNSIIPIIKGGEYTAVLGDVVKTWASDDDGWSLDCTFADMGWSSRQNQDGDFLITSPAGTEKTTALCSIVDPFGAENNQKRNFTFGQPFTASATITDENDIVLTIDLTDLASEITINAYGYQDSIIGTVKSFTVNNQAVTVLLSTNNLAPGEVIIGGTSSANNMLDFNFMLDFGLEKQSQAPIINVSISGNGATWDQSGLQFTLRGTVIDPDGESITMELQLCGSSTTDFTLLVGAVTFWEIDVSIATCIQQGINVNNLDVKIFATDESGVISNITVNVIDSDNDGYFDYVDSHPTSSNEWNDTDGDGFGDNSDACVNVFGNSSLDRDGCIDLDGDGVSDLNDIFPNNSNESYDSDLDGIGDNADVFPNDANETLDADNDGVGDNSDVFPNDANETLDTDNDGVGDNADAFPNNANETLDTDSDGVGDNSDAFPNDKNETIDSDNDGVGDNSDVMPNDPDVQTLEDLKSNSEENNNPTYLIAISIIILAAVILYVSMRKNNTNNNDVISTHQNQGTINRNEHYPQNLTNQLESKTIKNQWTDDSGYTWCEMSDGQTYWWDGNDWVLYQN
jgi:hypothetical protein